MSWVTPTALSSYEPRLSVVKCISARLNPLDPLREEQITLIWPFASELKTEEAIADS